MADIELPNPDDVAEQRRDTFTKRVALTVACYAVVLAVASLGGNNAAKETNLNQQHYSNQWAHYQARAVREHQYRIARERMQLDLASFPPDRRAEAEKLLAFFTAEVARYQADKKENEQDAKKFEELRDLNLRKDPYFDYAEVLLQIAIVLASVSMLANSRPVYFVSILTALLGALLTLNGYLLKFSLPFLES